MTQILDKNYADFINDLKKQIKSAQIKAHFAVNREMILLYFKIGLAILKKQKEEGWGSKIVEKVAKDLKQEFPDMTGISSTNLFSMRRFADIYGSEIAQLEFIHQVGGEITKEPLFNIPWRHHVVIMEQVSSNNERIWYIRETVKIKRLKKFYPVQIRLKIFQ